jgi:hypothetical protein
MKVIELKNIKKIYHLEKLEVSALHGIDLKIKHGEFGAFRQRKIHSFKLLAKPYQRVLINLQI